GHLREKLERALGGAQIAARQTEIAIDDADKSEKREIMPLGDELGADDDIDLALGNRFELKAEALDAAENVARHDIEARLGKALGNLLGKPLDAGTAGDQAVFRVAAWAGIGARLAMPTMM